MTIKRTKAYGQAMEDLRRREEAKKVIIRNRLGIPKMPEGWKGTYLVITSGKKDG